MEFDIKYIILWGGGALLVLVLLHGLWLGWRSRKEGAQAGAHADEQADLISEPAADAALDPAAEGAPAGIDEPAQIENGAGVERAPQRVVIPGKRTEPTVPRAQRMAERRRTEHLPPTGMEDVLVIWVVAPTGSQLDGHRLQEAFAASGLEYGGEVFYKLDANTRAELFTVANGVEPGTFDLSDVDAMSTPRIALLVRFSDRIDPSHAFEEMLQAAQDIADSLGAGMKDERMSDMSIQTVEHCRQRIRDYKRLSIRT